MYVCVSKNENMKSFKLLHIILLLYRRTRTVFIRELFFFIFVYRFNDTSGVIRKLQTSAVKYRNNA